MWPDRDSRDNRDLGNWVNNLLEEQAKRLAHHTRLNKARLGKLKVTKELMASIENPQWRQQLVEAICLGKFNRRRRKDE